MKKIKHTFRKGFTLIELLVVVAIIGILASVVISSVNQARSRGVDASIKGSMSSMRAQAEIFYDQGGTFSGVCDDTLFAQLTIAVENRAGEDVELNCYSDNSAWAASIPLTTATSDYFCVDSSGFAGDVVDDFVSGTNPSCFQP